MWSATPRALRHHHSATRKKRGHAKNIQRQSLGPSKESIEEPVRSASSEENIDDSCTTSRRRVRTVLKISDDDAIHIEALPASAPRHPSKTSLALSQAMSSSDGQPPAPLLHYLREHLNEFTSSIDMSTSHRFSVLDHITPAATRPQLQQQQRCRMLLLEPPVYAKTEALFQKSLVKCIASTILVNNDAIVGNSRNGRKRRSLRRSPPVTKRTESTHHCGEADGAPTTGPRLMQVHNAIREFNMQCQTCAAHGIDHRFGINGTVGDIHIVTPALSTPASSTPASSSSSSTHCASAILGGLIPPDTAVVIEVKNTHALNQKMLAQALLEMEVQKQLVCCQGREYLPQDEYLTPAALLKKPITNCLCTEAADTVLILWGSESCVITSANRATGQRNVEKEEQVFAWVKAVHALMPTDDPSRQQDASNKSRRGSAYDFSQGLNPLNVLAYARPLPKVQWNMRCADGTVLGQISFEVLSLHPSLWSTFGDESTMMAETHSWNYRGASTVPSGSSGTHMAPPVVEALPSEEVLPTDATTDTSEMPHDDVDSHIDQQPTDAAVYVAAPPRRARPPPRALRPQRSPVKTKGGRKKLPASAAPALHHEVTMVTASSIQRHSKRHYSSSCTGHYHGTVDQVSSVMTSTIGTCWRWWCPPTKYIKCCASRFVSPSLVWRCLINAL